MLSRLHIRNIALIDDLEIEFEEGLNVLTGETGAGKSIIIDSIGLLLGGRSDAELIRHGCDRASVEGEFELLSDSSEITDRLSAEEIEFDDGSIIISRELSISKSGAVKSVCRINGSVTTISTLKSITELMVDLHGQHEHQSLLSQSRHIAFLDAYAKNEIAELKKEVASAYASYNESKKALMGEFGSEAERLRRIDLLEYQINEIDSQSLKIGEDDSLNEERKILMNAEKIRQSLYSANELISGGDEGGALPSLKQACEEIRSISGLSSDYEKLYDELNEAYYALEGAAYAVRDLNDTFGYDEGRLNEIEERLNIISGLKRRYGGSIEKVLEYSKACSAELDELVNSEEIRKRREKQMNDAKKKYEKSAEQLTNKRKEAGKRFSRAVMAQLADMGLDKAKMEVNIERLSGEVPSSDGVDRVEFLLAANPKEPPKPLVKVASGGEVSRIMLSVKNVLAGCVGVDTMIFDEIDSGISGHTATIVGGKMYSIAKGRQVLAITHLPQIAAYGDVHFLIEKSLNSEGMMISHLKKLSYDERCREVARIMGGSDSKSATAHAVELIENANRYKNA